MNVIVTLTLTAPATQAIASAPALCATSPESVQSLLQTQAGQLEVLAREGTADDKRIDDI